MITVFLAFIELLGVDRQDCSFRLSIHESADVEAATAFWSEAVGVPVTEFRRPTLKWHSYVTNRHNRTGDYRGCLVINVMRSAENYRLVEGWWRGIVAGALRPRPDASE